MRANSAVNGKFLLFKKRKDLSDGDILQHLNELFLSGYRRGYNAGREYNEKQGLLDLPATPTKG